MTTNRAHTVKLYYGAPGRSSSATYETREQVELALSTAGTGTWHCFENGFPIKVRVSKSKRGEQIFRWI